MSLPITLAFFTTSKGHFGNQNIYLKTLEDFENGGYFPLFSDSFAHCKVSDKDNDWFFNEQRENIEKYIKNVRYSKEEWSHFSPSHSIGQLKDISKLIEEINTEFIFHFEDDWLIRPMTDNLEKYLNDAIRLLKLNPQIMQVRISRHADDENHYKTLTKLLDYNKQGEIWSFNPHIARTRDVQLICNLINSNWNNIEDLINKGQVNSELVFTEYSKFLSRYDKPFYSFKPELIRALHIGTKLGEEDKLN
jgi:hypothetical protein